MRYSRKFTRQTGKRLDAKPETQPEIPKTRPEIMPLVALMFAVLVPLASWLTHDLFIRYGVAMAFGTALLIAVLLVWWGPKWQVSRSVGLTSKNQFDRENEARKTLAQIVGGILVLTGLYSSMEGARLQTATLNLQREGQITDRYTKAIDQLGSMLPGIAGANIKEPNLTMRLGGIYALERVATDSPKDRTAIMEVLCAYVRQNAPRIRLYDQTALGEQQALTAAAPVQQNSERPREDIQAALTVIARREMVPIVRATSDFPKVDPYDVPGEGDHFFGKMLIKVDLKWSDLRGANLVSADLSGANLGWSDLDGAHLQGSNLFWADLRNASFDRADFARAEFIGTKVAGANLALAVGLTQKQMDGAIGDKDTRLPLGLHVRLVTQ